MYNKILLTTVLASWLIASTTLARDADTDNKIGKAQAEVRKFYVGTALDGAIFSTATLQEKTGANTILNKTGTLRFSCFFNLGFTFNWNLNRHLGVYTGVDIKNIGFIETNNDGQVVKRRSYNIGAPVGVKIGNMAARKPYLFLGGGIDVPFNYKEKSFIIRDQKTKLSEWLSDRTPAVMPYIFAGFAINHGFTLKFQYYPGNFLNPSFSTNGVQPYAGYDVHLVLVSVGYAVPVKKKHDLVTKEISHLNAQ